jgi:hypothetical protein
VKTIYTKITDYRAKKTKIETSILLDESGKKFVRKRAVHPEGKDHVHNIYQNYLLLKDKLTAFSYPNCWMEGDEFYSDFVEGQNLEELIICSSIERKHELFGNCLNILGKSVDLSLEALDVSGKLSALLNTDKSLLSLDLILSNIIVSENVFFLIDYEWSDGSVKGFVHLNRMLQENDFEWIKPYPTKLQLNEELFQQYEIKFMNELVGLNMMFPQRENLGQIKNIVSQRDNYKRQRDDCENQLESYKLLYEKSLEDFSLYRKDVLNSVSWKITRPLRVIQFYIRKFFK